MRFKKPHVATRDQVTITRDGGTAHIEYLDPTVAGVSLTIGTKLDTMSDDEVLAEHNRIVRLQEEARREHKHVAVEIPEGRPQIRFSPLSGQWVPRGEVIRCVIDGGEDDDFTIFIDDHELNLREFAGMLNTYAGWGARIAFVPDEQIAEDPIIEVRDIDDRHELNEERRFVARFYGGWYRRLPDRMSAGDEERDLAIIAMRYRGDRYADIACRFGVSNTLVEMICSDYERNRARYLGAFGFLEHLQENDDIHRRWPREQLIDALFMDSPRAANCLNRLYSDCPDLTLAELVDTAIPPDCHRAGTWREALPLHEVKNLGFFTYALIIHRLAHIRLGPSFKRYVKDQLDGLRDRLDTLKVAESRNPLSQLLQEKLKAHMSDLDEDLVASADQRDTDRHQASADMEGILADRRPPGPDEVAKADTPGGMGGLKPDVPGAASPTIEEVLAAFLAEQQRRLKKAAFKQYQSVIQLMTHCLNEYAYQYLEQEEHALFERYYNARGQEHCDFCELFGPEKIPEIFQEFLNYFMVRKVMCGKSIMRAAGTVTATLARWLGVHGYIAPEDAASEATSATRAAREFPAVEAFSEALFRHAGGRAGGTGESYDQVVEDHFYVTAVEPGRIHLEGVEGLSLCVNVPKKLSALCQGGWSMFMTLGRTRKGWDILDSGTVYPQ